MAGLGAEVIRIEPPGGDPLRMRQPLDGSGTSTYWHQMMAGKKSVVVDLDLDAGRSAMWVLLESADVLFESGHRERLEALGFGWHEISRRCPDLVYTTVSPFGTEGPRASWRGGDLVAMAAGGLMYLCGDPDRAPLRVSVEQASAQVGLQAMLGTLIALRARKVGARGQRVDVSMQEAITNTLGNSQASFVMGGTIFKRAGGGRATGDADNRLVWPCLDGYVAWGRSPASVGLLHQWMLDEGVEPGFDVEAWSQRPVAGPGAPTRDETSALDERIAAFLLRFPKMYLYEEGQSRGAMMCPVSTVPDLMANAQLRHRDFFRQSTHPDLGVSVIQPGPPFKMSVSPWSVGRTPQLGEHSESVLNGLKASGVAG
jgi:crotonobetainyl-CoA:carnitine CoA-transferase CaiB-like acyl-CoA transferase